MLGIDINPAVLVQSLGYFADIIQAVSIMMGLGIFMSGLFRLKRYAEMRTFMSHQMTIASPLLMLVGGICLLCLPTVLHSGLLNVWGTDNPMRYINTGGGWDQLMPAIVMFVRIIGVCAFMRGIVLFSRAGTEHGQHGMMAKCLLHVTGGLLCLNIVATVHLLRAILGFVS